MQIAKLLLAQPIELKMKRMKKKYKEVGFD